jgi:putative ABC transport system ATP-binding protein
MTKPNQVALTAENITVSYDGRKKAVNNVSLEVPNGALTLLTGESGSGKTTLLNVMGGIISNGSGELLGGRVMHQGTDIQGLTNKALTEWRGRQTGFAFQKAGLIEGLNLRDNILGPSRLAGNTIDRTWSSRLVARLGIASLLDRHPSQVSGGQAQRASFAAALVHNPGILFADEPTASLDTSLRDEIHGIMRTVVDELGTPIVLVSHDPSAANFADVVVHMRDGAIEEA